ncbi:MAG: 3D domain-containing protein [Phycisphaerales bacterium]|nr:3D domain-containing protein [Phycisphaerales bacterium]
MRYAKANSPRGCRARANPALTALAWTFATFATAASAIVVKELGSAPPLARVETLPARQALALPAGHLFADPEPEHEEQVVEHVPVRQASNIRWFDGRPVRPARVVTMVVTAYSPDARSCGDFADGRTATLHSVCTNAMQIVAADPRVLPYGSIVSVPGYASGDIVPVLDCGQAIKGNRLDVLYPSHSQARKWGRQRLKVTIWEYADGKPATNPRRVR